MKKKIKIIFIFLVIISVGILYLSFNGTNVGSRDFDYTSVKIYKGTQAYDLAKAIKNNNVKKIKNIVQKNPELLNYKDKHWDMPLLVWAIGNNKYDSTKALLECGADPNISSEVTGEFPLYRASTFFWKSSSYVEYEEDEKFIQLLLDYGADVNKKKYSEQPFNEANGTTALMKATKSGCEKYVKLLTENGADINSSNDLEECAAIYGLLLFRVSPEVAHYLIVEKHADITKPYKSQIDNSKELFAKDLLKSSIFMFSLDSEMYQIKKEIVKEFELQGVDYKSIPVSEYVLGEAKKEYKDNWEEYIEKF